MAYTLEESYSSTECPQNATFEELLCLWSRRVYKELQQLVPYGQTLIVAIRRSTGKSSTDAQPRLFITVLGLLESTFVGNSFLLCNTMITTVIYRLWFCTMGPFFADSQYPCTQ